MACKEKEEGGEEGHLFDDSLKERRLIIIGKTGNGKSTVGNLLLGKGHFRVGFSMTSTTVSASVGSADFKDWRIKVLDTPDISNLENVSDDRAQQEVSSWKALTSPLAHAILLAVRCDVRYTREEHQIYLQLKRLWGGNTLCRRLIVAFTFGDRQDRNIKDDLREVCPELKQVLKEASHRYLLFNDTDSPQGKERQVLSLLQMVDQLDAEVLRKEERRLLRQVQVCPPCPHPQVQVCPPGPQPHSPLRPAHPFMRRSSSSGSTSSRGSFDLDDIKLVLAGKPGTGKSSTGNTILGRAIFPVYHGNRGTIHSCMGEVNLDGKRIQVIDTPGLQNGPGHKDYEQERKRASQLVSPGPHALLYVVRHQHVTQEDLNGFRTLKQSLGQGLSHHTIIVLVGGSSTPSLSGDSPRPSPTLPGASPRPSPSPHELGGAQWDEGEVFPNLLQEAGSKLWIVSNEEVDVEARQRQLNDLMILLRGILNNSGGDYFHKDAVRECGTAGVGKELQEGKRNSCWFL